MRKIIALCATLTFLTGLQTSSAQPKIELNLFATGLTRPVDIANRGPNTDTTFIDKRLFIVEQAGYIRILDEFGNLNARPFLDIDASVGSVGN